MQTLGSKGQLRSGNQEGMFCSSIVLSRAVISQSAARTDFCFPCRGHPSTEVLDLRRSRKGQGCRPEPGGRKSWAEVRLWLSVCSSSSSGWPWLSSGEGWQGARLALQAAKSCLWFMRLGLCVCYGFSTGTGV